MNDTTGTQALWPQMIAALAAIDAELGLPDDGCNTTARTLAAIRRLRALSAELSELPPEYMLAKLAMVIPLFQEARDALTALNEAQRKLHRISPTLAERMDIAGTFSIEDWIANESPLRSEST